MGARALQFAILTAARLAPRGARLSDMTLSAVVRRMNAPAVPHGFRSRFRDWAAERALANTIGDKVEAAYRRGDPFERRRRMMTDWSSFCDQKAKGRVVSIRQRDAS